jgi:hypothetical protein
LWEKNNDLSLLIIDQNNIDEDIQDQIRYTLKAFRCVQLGNKFIFFLQDEIFENISNIDVTIIYRNINRDFYIDPNYNFESFSQEDSCWHNCYLIDNGIENEFLYRVNKYNKYSYLIFLDSNCNDEINFEEFANKNIAKAFELIIKFLGTHIVEKMSMSMLLTNNHHDDQAALPFFIDGLQKILSSGKNATIKELILLDFGNGFVNYYDENIFQINIDFD